MKAAAAVVVVAPAVPMAPVVLHRDEPGESEAEVDAGAPVRGLQMTDADRWKRAVDFLRDTAPRQGKALSFGRFLGLTAEGLRIAFPPEAGFYRATVFGSTRAQVEESLSKFFGRAIRLIEDTSAAASAPAAPRSIAEDELSARNAREQVIEHKVREHVAVKNVMRLLGGSLEHLQIIEAAKPAGPSLGPTENTAPEDDN